MKQQLLLNSSYEVFCAWATSWALGLMISCASKFFISYCIWTNSAINFPLHGCFPLWIHWIISAKSHLINFFSLFVSISVFSSITQLFLPTIPPWVSSLHHNLSLHFWCIPCILLQRIHCFTMKYTMRLTKQPEMTLIFSELPTIHPPKRKAKTPIWKLNYLEKTLCSFLANTVLSILFCSYRAVFHGILLIYFSNF